MEQTGEIAVNDFKAFLVSTSPRQRVLAAAVLAVAFAAVMFYFVYGSQTRQLARERATGASLQKNISTQSARIRDLEAASAGSAMISPSHRNALSLAGNTMFTSATLRGFMAAGLPDLAAGMGLEDVVVSEKPPEEARLMLEGGSSISVRRLPVTIEASGTFQSFADFSAQLWLSNQAIQVQSVKLATLDPMDTRLSVAMDLLCYYEEGIE